MEKQRYNKVIPLCTVNSQHKLKYRRFCKNKKKRQDVNAPFTDQLSVEIWNLVKRQ